MGHRPPYVAVITLSVLTAHHWRTIRLKLVLAGITDPMALPTMHILLDATESVFLESMSHGREAELERSVFLNSLYGPTPGEAAPAGGGQRQIPEGFSPEEVEDSFDAFAAAAM